MAFQEIAKHAYYNPVWSAWSKHRGLGELSRGHLTQQGMGGAGGGGCERIRADFLEAVKLEQEPL